ncbi:hypothetical protein Bbelb_386300 [Branchiostoma belcheri]|nr:hypothetical protein Bbelb_386300 [Branchiostoma belcheri]
MESRKQDTTRGGASILSSFSQSVSQCGCSCLMEQTCSRVPWSTSHYENLPAGSRAELTGADELRRPAVQHSKHRGHTVASRLLQMSALTLPDIWRSLEATVSSLVCPRFLECCTAGRPGSSAPVNSARLPAGNARTRLFHQTAIAALAHTMVKKHAVFVRFLLFLLVQAKKVNDLDQMSVTTVTASSSSDFLYELSSKRAFLTHEVLRESHSKNMVIFPHPDFVRSTHSYWQERGVKAPRASTAPSPDLAPTISRPGLLVVTVATQMCEEVHLYRFWPFHSDRNNRRLTEHYYDNALPSNSHKITEEFKQLQRLHNAGVIRLSTSTCQ